MLGFLVQKVGDFMYGIYANRKDSYIHSLGRARLLSHEDLGVWITSYEGRRGYVRRTWHRHFGEPLEVRAYRQVLLERE